MKEDSDYERVLERADLAMYQAKQSGKLSIVLTLAVTRPP